jgi:hypothetical protein
VNVVSPARRFAALVAAGALTFSTLAGGAGGSEEYQAHCQDLQNRITAAKTDMINGVLPQEDPSRFLSSMSCLDNILRMQFNFGVFFNMDALINKFMQLITDRVCSNASRSWDRVMQYVNQTVGVNTQLPWGVSATDPVSTTTYGNPSTKRLPFHECTTEDKQAALAAEIPPEQYPDGWYNQFGRLNSGGIWVPGAKGSDKYPQTGYARLRGYQFFGDILSIKVVTPLQYTILWDLQFAEMPGTDDGLTVTVWFSECPQGAILHSGDADASLMNACIASGIPAWGKLDGTTDQTGQWPTWACHLDAGKTYYMNMSFMKDGSFEQPTSDYVPKTPNMYPTNLVLEWRRYSHQTSGYDYGGPGDGTLGCPAADPGNVVDVGFDTVTRQTQQSGVVRYLPIPASTMGRASVIYEQSIGTSTAAAMHTDMWVSQCPGVDLINVAPQCRISSDDTTDNRLTIYSKPVNGWTDQATLSNHGCWAPASSGPWYLNYRWTYDQSTCASGACGFVMQWFNGPY